MFCESFVPFHVGATIARLYARHNSMHECPVQITQQSIGCSSRRRRGRRQAGSEGQLQHANGNCGRAHAASGEFAAVPVQNGATVNVVAERHERLIVVGTERQRKRRRRAATIHRK